MRTDQTAPELVSEQAEEARARHLAADHDEVTRAEQERVDAERAVEELEARVVAGDTKVTPASLDKATSTSRFARLKVERARRKAEEEERAAWIAQLERAKTIHAEALDGSAEEVRHAFDQCQAWMIRLGEATASHNAKVDAAARSLDKAGRDMGVEVTRRGGRVNVHLDGELTKDARLGTLVAAAAWLPIERYGTGDIAHANDVRMALYRAGGDGATAGLALP